MVGAAFVPDPAALDEKLSALRAEMLVERRGRGSARHERPKRGARVIMDPDDQRRHDYGEWYSDSNRLTLERLEPVTG